MRPLRVTIALALAIVLSAGQVPIAGASIHAQVAPVQLGVVPFKRLALTPSNTAPRSSSRSTDAPDPLIVRMKDGPPTDALAQVYDSVDSSAGAVSVIRADVLKWRVPRGSSSSAFAKRLVRTGKVAYAVPDYTRQFATTYVPPPYVTPNDPAYTDASNWTLRIGSTVTNLFRNARSWWLRDVKAADAWSIAYTGSDIVGKYPLRADPSTFKVAVIDSGFYLDHPDRTASITGEPGRSVTPADPLSVTGTSSYADKVSDVSHGTCTAGLIGAAAGNAIGTLGVARDTQVIIYKAYFGGAGIKDSDMIAAIRRATDQHCKVINLSIAGPQKSKAVQDAVDYAHAHGVVVVAATGNTDTGSVSYPAACTYVVGVGALTKSADGSSTQRATFSNYGTGTDLVAPGEMIWGLTRPGWRADADSDYGYTWWDGTSMASPITAGAIAWLWRAAPFLSNDQVVALVQNTAHDLGAAGTDSQYGHGELDMAAAYNSLATRYPLLARPTLTSLSADNARAVRIAWSAVPGYAVRHTVSLDGRVVSSGLAATSLTLPRMTVGTHTVTIRPMSIRNWADGSEVLATTFTTLYSTPLVRSFRYYRGKLLWSDTEVGTAHSDRLYIEGTRVSTIHGSKSTSALRLGKHTAVLTVVGADGARSIPTTLTFTKRQSPTVSRAIGTNRYSTAVTLSRRSFTRASTVVIATGASWRDALTAAPLAAAVRAPVLLTERTSLPRVTADEITRLRAKQAIVIGPTSSVTAAVQRALRRKGLSVLRVSGADSFGTANAVARELAKRTGGSISGGRALVVGESDFASALAASAVAARKRWPLVITHASTVPVSTRSTLASIGVTAALVVGTTSSVSDSALAELPSPLRVSASTRAGISAALAVWATSNYPTSFSGQKIYLVSNSGWTSGLAVGAVAARSGALVLLSPKTMAVSIRSYYKTNSEIAVTTRVVAGTGTIANSVISAIKAIVGAP